MMASRHFMNPSVGRHLGQQEPKPEPHQEDSHEGGDGSHPHSVSVHHAGPHPPHPSHPHHVHVHHADGRHEHSEHANFDEAMDHARSMAGGGEEQDEERNEYDQGDGAY